MGSVKHWGEIPEADVEMITDVTADIERSMNKFCLDQYDQGEKQEDEIMDHVSYAHTKQKGIAKTKILDCSQWIRSCFMV